MFWKNASLIRGVFLVVFVSIVVLTGVIGFLAIRSYRREVSDNMRVLRKVYVAHEKAVIKNQVNSMISLIDHDYTEESAKEEVYLRDEGVKLLQVFKMFGLWEPHPLAAAVSFLKNNYPRAFIVKPDGTVVYYPDMPWIKNIRGIKDAFGHPLFPMILSAARKKQGGFVYSFRFLGHHRSGLTRMVTYVRRVESLGVILGVEGNISVNEIEKDVGGFLSRAESMLRLGHYVFVSQLYDIYGGECFARVIVNPEMPDSLGRCISSNQPDEENFYYRNVYLGELRTRGSSFVTWACRNPRTGEQDTKTAYFRLYKPLMWIVGSGFYGSSIDRMVGMVRRRIESNARTFLLKFGIAVVVVLVLLVAFYVAVIRNIKRARDLVARETERSLKLRSPISSGIENKCGLCRTEEIRELVRRVNSIINFFEKSEMEVVESFVSSLEVRDIYTKGHSQRVAFYAERMAEAMGFDTVARRRIYRAGLLHDVGKLGIPDHILLKPGRLTESEYAVMKYHPVFSYEILSSMEPFRDVAEIVRHHHEKCNGSGYPDGLTCERMSMESRILVVADIFDALTSDRPYRKRVSSSEALNILRAESVDGWVLERCSNVLLEACLESGDVETKFVPPELERMRREVFDIDPITRLPRREKVEEVSNRLIERRVPFIVFVVDVGGLFLVNCKFSFGMGDVLLSAVGEALRRLPVILGAEPEVMGRVMGDSFMVVFRRSRVKDIGVIRRTVHSYVRSYVFGVLRERYPDCVDEAGKHISGYVSFDVSYAVYSEDASSFNKLILVCYSRRAS